ncbi:MAG: bacillithiol biosynthesis deacetylase BshB1 [Ignavibacteria bacterium RBG_13_36_8]|nr:MAG: bacillithiol biosynthesis deacetylase BshB1 [Ignavibacteria bacterium RBG_13_36_8]
MNLDILVFAAHPDDAELSMGGTIARLTGKGIKVGIIDLTKGELGTRGTVELRQKEAEKASKILHLTQRVNLGLPDGKLYANDESVDKVISMIRKYKPQIIFASYFNDRHPDHVAASEIVKRGMFLSGLTKIKTSCEGKKQEPYRPKKLFYYMHMYEFDPTFIVDISKTFKTKMEAVMAYGSQFYDSKSEEPETFISQPNFLKFLEARARIFGFKIGKDFGEPFYCEENIEFDFECMLEKTK